MATIQRNNGVKDELMTNKIKVKTLLNRHKTICWHYDGYKKGTVEDFIKDFCSTPAPYSKDDFLWTDDNRIFRRFNYGFFITDNGCLAFYSVPGDFYMSHIIESKKIFVVFGRIGAAVYDTETGKQIWCDYVHLLPKEESEQRFVHIYGHN